MENTGKFDDDAMVSVLQQAMTNNKGPLKKLILKTDDECYCLDFAVQSGFIDYKRESTNSKELFESLSDTGRDELNKLIRERPGREREKMFLKYASDQAKYSLWSYHVARCALVCSVIYLVVAVVALWFAMQSKTADIPQTTNKRCETQCKNNSKDCKFDCVTPF